MSTESRKVDFVIAGTQKGGTTALDTYLRAHLEICMAKIKEVHFFDEEKYFHTNEIDYSKYHENFNIQPPHKILGEATPIYMYWYDCPKRIWAYNPHMKVIVILRNPVERAYSHWNWERNRGAIDLTFRDAIQGERERAREALPEEHRVHSYIHRGYYSEQLRRIRHYFPKKQTLAIKNEELRTHPQETLDRVCHFLSVDPLPNIDAKEVLMTPYVTSIQVEEREYLQRIFEYEIRELERMLNWDCREWLK